MFLTSFKPFDFEPKGERERESCIISGEKAPITDFEGYELGIEVVFGNVPDYRSVLVRFVGVGSIKSPIQAEQSV